jgi:hypothetical protein
MIAMRFPAAAALALLLTGCIMAEYEDVASDARYSRFPGQQFNASSQL